MATMEIRHKAEECVAAFKRLQQIDTEVGEDDQAEGAKDRGIRIDDHFARFRMWAGNIGVFATGHASLDHRLRESEDLRGDMVGILSTLHEFLSKATDALRPGFVPTSIVDDGSSDNNLLSISSAISSSFRGTETESTEEELAAAAGGLGKRFQGIERTIDALYRLSVLIRQPSIAGQNKKAENFKIRDQDGRIIDEDYEGFVRRYVTHRLPKAPKELQERLIRGIITRRKRVLYRQHHQRKLMNDMDDDNILTSNHHRSVDGTDKASTITAKASNIAELDLIVGRVDKKLQGKKLTVTSHTSASALLEDPSITKRAFEDEESRPSTVITNVRIRSNLVAVPDPPKPPQNSKEFECPYCCIILPITDAKAIRWRKHVMEDLQPYNCIIEGCSSGDRFFTDTHAWLAHMHSAHASEWVCSAQGHEPSSFGSQTRFEDHLRAEHHDSITESQVPLLADRAKTPGAVLFHECPLCLWVPVVEQPRDRNVATTLTKDAKDAQAKKSSDSIVEHLVEHLQGLSVFALPWQDADERPSRVDSESNKAEEVSTQSEDGSRDGLLPVGSSQWVDEGDEQGSPITSPSPDPGIAGDLPPLDHFEDWRRIPRLLYHGHDRDPVLQPWLRTAFLNTDSGTGDIKGPILPNYIIPVSRNEAFFGRTQPLATMEAALCPGKAIDQGAKKPMTFPRSFTIYGPGGMGKTQIAAEFAHAHKAEFDVILWVRAEDNSKLSQDFKDIAVQLGLLAEDSMDALDLNYARDVLKRWLVHPLKNLADQDGTKTPDLASWLMIFDGVVTGDILNEVWPYDAPGSILITSRNPHSWSTSLELKPWSNSVATGYIFNRTNFPQSDEEKSAAITIANRLGGLPLALAHVAGILMHQEITLKQFVQYYGKREGDEEFLQWSEIDAGPASVDYSLSVASVWAFDSLGPGAVLLINTLALLDPDGVPENLFRITSGTWDSVGDVAQIKEDYEAAREELFARSLITESKREQKLTIHRLVQESSRSKMRPSELRRTFLNCIGLISGLWPFEQLSWRHGTSRWAACEDLFPHVQKLKSIYSTITPAPESFDDYGFAQLLIDAGWYLHERGNSAEAIFFNNMAQAICDSFKLRILEEPESAEGTAISIQGLNYSLAEILHNRGCIALEINEPSDALHYHRLFNSRMVRELEKKPERKDIRLGISWNELGNAYMLNDDWKTGEECFIKSIQEMERLENSSKSKASLPLANLGLSYWLQKKYAKAEDILMKGLEERVSELGEDDKESFISGRFFHAIGNVRGSQGKRDESHSYHRRLLFHYKATLGNRHHRTADAFSKLAEHHIIEGDHDTALMLLDAAQSAYSLSNHFEPEKMRAIWFRVKALNGLGRPKEAEVELAKCFQIYSWIMSDRGDERLTAKQHGRDLVDKDIDRLIAFWSR